MKTFFSKTLLVSGLFLGLTGVAVAQKDNPLLATGDADSRVPCATVPPTSWDAKDLCPLIVWGDPDAPSTKYVGAKANPGLASNPIDVPVNGTQNGCWYVKNGSSGAFFVPFRTWEEWSGFTESALHGKASEIAELIPCARQTLAPVEPSSSCENASVGGKLIKDSPITYQLPYEAVDVHHLIVRPATPLTQAFKCDGKSLQIVTINWIANTMSPYQERPKSGWNWPYAHGLSGWTENVLHRESGGCGSANGVLTPDAPDEDDLCSGAGVTHSALTRANPWTWSCTAKGSDKTNSETVNCSAPLKAECGSAANHVTSTAPDEDLCNRGAVASKATSSGAYWVWTCSAATTVSCRAPIGTCTECEKDEGCGPAAGHPLGVKPSRNLCLSGGTASSVDHVSGTKPYWIWTCKFPKQTYTCTAKDCGCD